LRYDVHARLLNAADHGAPQRRERVFFVGFRADLEIDWRFPPSTHGRDALLRDQASGAYWDRHGLPRPKTPRARLAGMDSALLPWRTVRDALDGLPDPERDPTADTIPNHRFQPGARSYPGHTGSDLDSPAKTLKAGVHGVPGGENMLRRPDGSIRYFTIRETARLQTFPDDYVFHGAWSEAMRQLGNAAPVLLARAVGGAVAEALRGADSLRSRCPGNTLS
jgi:DNA (cytosine-5)-methyltransferase 1